MRAARLKGPTIIVTVIGAALGLLAWSQLWFTIGLDEGATASLASIDVPGSIASPAISALSLAALALAAALGIAGPGIRIVLGVLETLLGGCIILAAALTLSDPVAAVSPAVTEATGVAGEEPTAALVGSIVTTMWPALALLGGVLVLFAGLVVLATGTRWRRASTRFRTVRLEHDGAEDETPAAASDRAVDDWDELSRGDDPTESSGGADTSR